MRNNLKIALYAILFPVLIGAVPLAQGADAEPDKSLNAAHESFMKKDMKTAGADIHRAGDYIRQEGDKLGGDSKKAFHDVADETDKLAKGVENGTVKTEGELKHGFAKTEHGLAKAWHGVAGDAKAAGKDTTEALKKAAHSLDAAAKWSGANIKEGTHKAVKAVKEVPDDAKVAADKVGGWFDHIGDGIKDVGHHVSGQ